MFKNRSFDLFFKIYFYLVSRWQLFSSTLNGLSLHVLHTLYVHLFAFTLRNKFSQSTCTTDLQRNNKKIKKHKQKSKKKKIPFIYFKYAFMQGSMLSECIKANAIFWKGNILFLYWGLMTEKISLSEYV